MLTRRVALGWTISLAGIHAARSAEIGSPIDVSEDEKFSFEATTEELAGDPEEKLELQTLSFTQRLAAAVLTDPSDGFVVSSAQRKLLPPPDKDAAQLFSDILLKVAGGEADAGVSRTTNR